MTPDDPPADPGFDDEFDGTALDGCRWDKIHNWKGERIDVADGKLAIETFDADISGASNGPIENLILQTPPEGDWTVETKMTAPLKDNWQLAGLMLFQDADHYVKYDVVADNAPGAAPVRRVELRYENGGNLTGPSGVSGPRAAGQRHGHVVAAADEDRQRLHRPDQRRRADLGRHAGLGQHAVHRHARPRRDGHRAAAERRPDRRRVRPHPPRRGRANAAPEIAAATATPARAPRRCPWPSTWRRPIRTATPCPTRGTSASTAGRGHLRPAAPEYTYAEPGTYTAKVTVSDGELEATEEVTVTVTRTTPGAPRCRPSPSGIGRGAAEGQLQRRALDPDGGAIVKYAWTFPGGTALGQAHTIRSGRARTRSR